MPKISVIVPVYNTEKYLHRCIDSILAQTFTDFEVLLIDDGSTDSSGTICDEYAAKDSRVRVFHKANGGVSSARNLGLDNAKGEWISFVDADDWVENNWLEILLEIISKDDDLKIVRFGYFCNEGDLEHKIVSEQDHILVEKEDFLEQNDVIGYYAMLWNSLFKYDIIGDKVRFDTTLNWSEDFIFSYECYLLATKMYISSIPLYHYRILKGGLSNIKNPFMIRAAIQKNFELKLSLASCKELKNKINRNYHYWISRSIKELYRNKYNYDIRYNYYNSMELKNTLFLSYIERVFFAKCIPFCVKDSILKVFFMFKIK